MRCDLPSFTALRSMQIYQIFCKLAVTNRAGHSFFVLWTVNTNVMSARWSLVRERLYSVDSVNEKTFVKSGWS